MKKGRIDTRQGAVNAWAYCFGGAVGWGAFMMPGNIFLPEAGPLGSVLGIAIAAIFMVFIGVATSYMAKKYPTDAGVHVYIGKILGHDHGFLSAWAILLAYLSILWANSTALILLIRFIWGDVLQFGLHYTLATYEVYFGETIVTILVLVTFGVLASIGKEVVRKLYAVLAILQIGIVIVLFIGILIKGNKCIDFGFALTSVSNPMEVFNIIMIAPWMYVGFEAFMYMFNTTGRKDGDINRVMSTGIVTIGLAYILPILMIVYSLPDGVITWQDYLRISYMSEGLQNLPLFYSTYIALGNIGLYALIVCILCAISTSLLCMYRASAILMSTMADEEIMPPYLSKKNKNGDPYPAVLTIMGISILMSFGGRTAIGWIVDITTITANIVYVYSMVACFMLASKDEKAHRSIKVVAIFGLVVSIVSFLFLLIPNIFSENKLASESYFILAIWCIVGLFYYWFVYRTDKKRLYGKSPIMWVFMAYLIFFSSIMWVRQKTLNSTGILIGWQKDFIEKRISTNAVIEMILVVVVLIAIYSLFNILINRQIESDKKSMESELKSKAKSEFLFNMSHDIRTPMNAILGFTDLALLDTENPEKMKDYLEKIKSSGDHLLSLINDILEMSRIENGKIVITNETVDLIQLFSNIDSITRGLAEAKGQTLTVNTDEVVHRYVYTDHLRLNQILLNLVSNAVKYTQEGGDIRISIKETAVNDDVISYRISVKDNGMGMTPEFAEKVFEAFERDNSNVSAIQGTGLGMAITKSIVDLMGGQIHVDSMPNEGSDFIVDVSFEEAKESDVQKLVKKGEVKVEDFKGKRVLLADDYEINREIATAILELYGFIVEEAEDGKDALEQVINHPTHYYDLIFMDIQMPRMNGYDAAKAVRSLSDKDKATIPIIAMTANAFEEDVKNAKAAGMNGHVAKPIDQEKLVEEIAKALS